MNSIEQAFCNKRFSSDINCYVVFDKSLGGRRPDSGNHFPLQYIHILIM